MEIIQELSEREYDSDLITTAPSVVYGCKTDGSILYVDSPAKLPATNDVEEFQSLSLVVISLYRSTT